jgi:hypothetical protein
MRLDEVEVGWRIDRSMDGFHPSRAALPNFNCSRPFSFDSSPSSFPFSSFFSVGMGAVRASLKVEGMERRQTCIMIVSWYAREGQKGRIPYFLDNKSALDRYLYRQRDIHLGTLQCCLSLKDQEAEDGKQKQSGLHATARLQDCKA